MPSLHSRKVFRLAAVPSPVGRPSYAGGPARAPQAAATEGLYERHAGKILSYCLHQLGSREEAEDAVQTTFMNAFRALGRGVVPEAESAWLFKIAENVCLSRRRSSWRRGRIESPSDFDVIEEVVPGPSRQRDELIGIEDALASMPEQQRRAILLREWQGLSYREISEELELSQSAVETLIFRARRSLAQGLEQPDLIKKPKRKGFRRALHLIDVGTLAAAAKTLLDRERRGQGDRHSGCRHRRRNRGERDPEARGPLAEAGSGACSGRAERGCARRRRRSRFVPSAAAAHEDAAARQVDADPLLRACEARDGAAAGHDLPRGDSAAGSDGSSARRADAHSRSGAGRRACRAARSARRAGSAARGRPADRGSRPCCSARPRSAEARRARAGRGHAEAAHQPRGSRRLVTVGSHRPDLRPVPERSEPPPLRPGAGA